MSFTIGNPMGDSVENCLSLNGTEKLIRVPTGCAEQTMVKMAPTVYAIEYMDASEQWKNFNPERKDEAIKLIEKGTQKKGGKKTTKQHRDQQNWLCYLLTLCTNYCNLLKE